MTYHFVEGVHQSPGEIAELAKIVREHRDLANDPIAGPESVKEQVSGFYTDGELREIAADHHSQTAETIIAGRIAQARRRKKRMIPVPLP